MIGIWTAIVQFAAGLLEKVIGPIFEERRQRRAENNARDAGTQIQRAADAVAGLKEAQHAQQARGSVGSDDDSVDRMLRPPAERTGR